MRRGLGMIVVSMLVACGPSLSKQSQQCLECALRRGGDEVADREAARWLANACSEGDARSCSVLGVMHEEGRGVTADPTKAAQLFQRACLLDDLQGCVHYGRTLVGDDADIAKTFFETACSAGNTEGCYELAVWKHRRGESGVAALLEKACDARHARACAGLGAILRSEGHETKADVRFAAACALGEAQACTRLGAPAARTTTAVAGARQP